MAETIQYAPSPEATGRNGVARGAARFSIPPEIFQRLQAGDETALENLMKAGQRYFIGVVIDRNIPVADAGPIVNEVFMLLYQKAPGIKRNPTGYLNSIVASRSKMYHRSRNRRGRHEVGSLDDPTYESPDMAIEALGGRVSFTSIEDQVEARSALAGIIGVRKTRPPVISDLVDVRAIYGRHVTKLGELNSLTEDEMRLGFFLRFLTAKGHRMSELSSAFSLTDSTIKTLIHTARQQNGDQWATCLRHFNLSPMERMEITDYEVGELLALGLPQRDISEMIGRSSGAVGRSVRRLQGPFDSEPKIQFSVGSFSSQYGLSVSFIERRYVELHRLYPTHIFAGSRADRRLVDPFGLDLLHEAFADYDKPEKKSMNQAKMFKIGTKIIEIPKLSTNITAVHIAAQWMATYAKVEELLDKNPQLKIIQFAPGLTRLARPNLRAMVQGHGAEFRLDRVRQRPHYDVSHSKIDQARKAAQGQELRNP